jgi:hypothetical protein
VVVFDMFVLFSFVPLFKTGWVNNQPFEKPGLSLSGTEMAGRTHQIWPNMTKCITQNQHWACLGDLPSGKLTVCYWKLPFMVDLPINNGDFP